MLDLGASSGAYKDLNTRSEKIVRRCLFWGSLEGLLTPADRIRLKKDDMSIDRGTDSPFGGVWRVSGRSSARVKVIDEPLYVDGGTSGLASKEVGRR